MRGIELAKRWTQLVKDKAVAEGQEPEQGEGEGEGAGSGSEMSDEMKEMIGKIISDLIESAENSAGETQIATNDDLADQQDSEESKEQLAEKNKKSDQQNKDKEIADKVFSRSSGGPETGTSSSRLMETRQPTSEERIASVRVSQMLERAKYRERDETQISSIVPPGRLRARAIVQNTAYRARGQMAQAKPFRRTVRKHTDEPTLNVGVMVDISGSMGSAMNPMATTAWIMSEAVNRIQGNCAMVYYGNDVFPTLSVGERLDKVNVYSASDGTEKFQKAFQALDGSLNLLNGNGARLLVIVSDGEYVPEETKRAKEIVEKCKASGVAILWLPFDNGRGAKNIGEDYAEIVLDINQPAETAEVIGRSAQAVMTRIGERESA